MILFNAAKELLEKCERSELRDHAFGDSEVTWRLGDVIVADGGDGRDPYVCVTNDGHVEIVAEFNGDEARTLLRCGRVGRIERNDSTGPEDFVPGRCMEALSLRGVFRELTGAEYPGKLADE